LKGEDNERISIGEYHMKKQWNGTILKNINQLDK